MVQTEKEAREKERLQRLETQKSAALLQEELKALKTLVEHLQTDPNGRRRRSIVEEGEEEAAEAEPSGRTADAQLFQDFALWHQKPSLQPSGLGFMARVVAEDVTPCLAFRSATAALSAKLHAVIVDNGLVVAQRTPEAEDVCALTQGVLPCTFELSGGDLDKLTICAGARNRVIAVANLYTYCRYVVQGLVKAPVHEVFWKIADLRLAVAKARLGFAVE